MDGLIFLMIGALLAVPISIVVLFVKLSGLNTRLSTLEADLRKGAARLAPSALSASPATQAEAMAPASETIAAPDLAAGSGDLTPDLSAPPSDEPLVEAAPQTSRPDPWAAAASGRQKAAAPQPARVSPVVRNGAVTRLIEWVRVNWVYAVSALSLALAGIFLVQYGIERGLLPPALRVTAGVAFGLALVGAGEYLRRRFGDDPAGTMAHLPATFSGAGVVSIFAAIVAARQMYGLIGPEAAFVAQVATAVLAVVLGWYNGAFLVAVGLLGAAASPFIVSGDSASGPWLYAYFALIAAIGLTVDTIRRWAWVSVLAMVLGYLGGVLTLLSISHIPGFAALMVVLPILATVVPERGWLPRQDGPAPLGLILDRGKGVNLPSFPVVLVLGSVLASVFGLFLQASGPSTEAMLIFGAMTLLALAYLVWAEPAKGLADVALLPAVIFCVAVLLAGLDPWNIAQDFAAQAIALRPPETAAPRTLSLLLAMAFAMTAGFAWRALRGGELALVHGLAATLTAPVTAALLELTWDPAAVLGPFAWALHVIALAAAMVALAARFASQDGTDHRRMAHATLSALSLVALSLFILTSATALTLALAVLIIVAAALDRRFGLPEMGLFIQIGIAVLTWRLIIDPGMDAAMNGPLGQVLLAWFGSILGCAVALWLIRPMNRTMTRILTLGALETAMAGYGALLVNVLISRWLIDASTPGLIESHWSLSLNAMPWVFLMLAQAYRARLGGTLRRLRLAMSILAGVIGGALLVLSATVANPLFVYWAELKSGLVRGPLVLDTLALAYGLPGLVLIIAALRMPGLGSWTRRGVLAVGASLAALYAGLEIRRFWRGDWLGASDVTQPELYTYTVALMLLGAALLYQAFAKRSTTLRRIAMAVIALVIAKVFLIDASGLTGLTRVFSFLGLGLSLAGLALLNRWVGDVMKAEGDKG